MSNAAKVEALEPAAVKRLLDAGRILLVDVREPAEFAAERIPGALLFPLSTSTRRTATGAPLQPI